MSLEVATFVSQLVSTNPVATDKKNQGDDHFRLIKAVLQSTLPNASRAFRFPDVVGKTANYNVLEADENKTILVDATAGAFTLTLPAGLTFNAWVVKVMKIDVTTNPIYVAPPSGQIGFTAKIRINVPFVEHIFIWTGSTFIRCRPPGEVIPGTLETFAGASAPVGYAFATGQSLLRVDHPELFAFWSTTWGAADGTHFNAPDPRNRFIVGAGSTYALGATGGADTVTLTSNEMPVHSHGITDPGHNHSVDIPLQRNINFTGFAAGGQVWFGDPGTSEASGNAGTGISINNAGSGNAHENRPPYMAMNLMFRLC